MKGPGPSRKEGNPQFCSGEKEAWGLRGQLLPLGPAWALWRSASRGRPPEVSGRHWQYLHTTTEPQNADGQVLGCGHGPRPVLLRKPIALWSYILGGEGF